ncbi:hypothetical protein [Frigoriglobus tundricola]|uniref:Uncharacterized protein n=1 Tax=Frigoriglobus tundricola TaxID=2774151 RepID=A0A6M5YRB8_9BACT|nr:hypothetical protein [Frigoriglobus tundricola]QJW95833.1 hypothetical protein FTUN_3387 [Frigoriglobus tundricola]
MTRTLHFCDDGEPVPGVVTLDGQEAPPWEVAEARLLEMRDGESLSFETEGDAWLIVLHIAEYGYLISGCERGEVNYFTLVERARGDEPVTAFDGGDTRVFVRYAFVTQSLLLKALKTVAVHR